MSLQFTVEDVINPLVSLSDISSVEEMKVDGPPSVIEVESSVSDIEFIACYSEQQPPRLQTVGGRGMIIDLPTSEDNFSLYDGLYGPSTNVDSDPAKELVEFVLENNPPISTPRTTYQQPIAMCSQLEPLLDTPLSPAHERGPNSEFQPLDPWEEEQFQYQPENPH